MQYSSVHTVAYTHMHAWYSKGKGEGGIEEDLMTYHMACHSHICVNFLAIMATFLGDNAGLKIGNMTASIELPCSWRNNNLSSKRKVSKRGPKAARRDQ